MILLNKRQKLYKKTSLKQWISNRSLSMRSCPTGTNKGSSVSNQGGLTSLTWPTLDEKRMKQERGAQQSMTGLRTWLCYIEILLASTVIENIFFALFSSPWSCIEYCNSAHKTQTIGPVCTLMFSTMLYMTVWSIFFNYKCSHISIGSENVPHMRHSHMPHMRQQVE
jgi:hypothetical protein